MFQHTTEPTELHLKLFELINEDRKQMRNLLIKESAISIFNETYGTKSFLTNFIKQLLKYNEQKFCHKLILITSVKRIINNNLIRSDILMYIFYKKNF